MGNGIPYTEYEILYLEENYSKMTVRAMAKDLGRPVGSVVHYMNRHQFTSRFQRYYNRKWTDDENEYVADNVGIKTWEEMGRHLRRTAGAVMEQARRKKLSMYDNFFSFRVLCRELNKCSSTVKKWVARGWIKYERAHFKGRFGKHPMMFKEQDIVRFLKEHYTHFDPAKIRNPYFKNVVREAYQRNHGGSFTGSVNYTRLGHYPPYILTLSY